MHLHHGLAAGQPGRVPLTAARFRNRLDAVVSTDAYETPARDDTQSSAAVLSSRLISAVGASMSDGPCVWPARRGTGGLSRDRRALSSAHRGWGKGDRRASGSSRHDAP
jgi:hypothetical protein